jgi:hypothetical protein
MDESQSFSALHEWFLTPQGRDLNGAFAAELRLAPIRLQGRYLLQLGHCGTNAWLDEMAYSSQWILSPEFLETKHSIISSLTAMPMERESMDCIIAPLTLEFCGQAKNPLDEIDRILKPMGYLIFFGINPWSFWGASLRWGRLSCFAHVSAAFSSSLSLKHAMVARGYTQCRLSSFYYLPPVGSEYWLRKLEFLNQMSKMVWPYPAGFYCLILQKQDPCITPLRHEWHLAQMNSI